MTGPVVLVVALAAALALAVLLRRRDGRFRAPTAPDPAAPADDRPTLTAADVDAPLGEEVTLVQFSTAFCAPCRATRPILDGVASARPGVAWVEVDAESHLDLVRRLDVRRTPTVLLLDADGRVVTRSSGLPRREDVERLVDAVLATSSSRHPDDLSDR